MADLRTLDKCFFMCVAELQPSSPSPHQAAAAPHQAPNPPLTGLPIISPVGDKDVSTVANFIDEVRQTSSSSTQTIQK